MNNSNFSRNQRKHGLVYLVRFFAPLLWALAILCLSLTSSPPEIPGPLGWDKLLHAGAYALLAFLLIQFFDYACHSINKAFWSAFFVALGYGALIEVLQWVGQAGRTAEWWDLLADALGALVGCVIFRHAVRLLSRHHGNEA